jgi:hypothetical protein
VRLDAAAISDRHAALDLDEWSDEGIVSDGASIEIDGFDDGDSPAKSHVDDRRLAKGWYRH